MPDKMQPFEFLNLLKWVISEYGNHKSIFGIPSAKFHKVQTDGTERIFGEILETPFGPAAGPHTQMAQNIICAYLTGGRFFELKTVQKLDNLKIDKPCIDAQDEGYNVEWSQELSLDESYSEYIKAWILIHLIKELLNISKSERGFVFNMSVGYDLEGIKSERMNRFIDGLRDASGNDLFTLYKSQLLEQLWDNSAVKLIANNFSLTREKIEDVISRIRNISPLVSNSVTLSTMHGCPPAEIEAIARYLIKEKNLHTYVKLNPTLLGYDFVNNTLHRLGYKYINLDKSSFDHDLQYIDAIPIINRLRAFAAANNRVFGIKLSNTLGVKNTLQALPGNDMYMSGRAIFPLTINLADKLAAEFKGEINISYSGGATNSNIQEIVQTGISPITFVTDLLKPGGYLRMSQITETAEKNYLKNKKGDRINLPVLRTIAEESLNEMNYIKEKREVRSIKIKKNLPLLDCFIAPCQEACPIHQDVASYIRLVEQGKYAEAFELIVSKNPLPHITGYICDHQCMYHCTRWDYDDPLLIRDLKKEAAEKGYKSYIKKFNFDFPDIENNIKIAVIGAGPSGLSAAYFLAKAGFDVTVFEREMNAGGIVSNILPRFRLPQEAIEKDIEFIERHGIRFIFGMDPDYSIKKLNKEGFKYIYIAIGAESSNKIELTGDNKNIFGAIEFLKDFHFEKRIIPGISVAVIGGGNSAMDSARAAKRSDGVENVYLIYRRTSEQMPADKEEFHSALKDGVEFKELLLPVKFIGGVLTCQKMKLADTGKDGRINAVPIEGEFIDLKVDSVISAIGESLDTSTLTGNKINFENGKVKTSQLNETMTENVFIGGDALRGPSTVVESIADGKTAADAIIKKEKRDSLNESVNDPLRDDGIYLNELTERKGIISGQVHTDLISEAGRCLGCNFICNKCVEVCPNRANIPLEINSSSFKDKNQILHLDAFCNECGNCETFCPYQGAPYKDKLTLFTSEEEFRKSSSDGFLLKPDRKFKTAEVRWEKQSGIIELDEEGNILNSSFTGKSDLGNLVEIIKSIRKDYYYLLHN